MNDVHQTPYGGSGARATFFSDDGQMPRFGPIEDLFKGRHFDQEIVVWCVRWYLSYKLSYRDLVTMMSERGIGLAHTTILRWVQHYTPEFEQQWSRYARPVGGSWRCDETYIKVKGCLDVSVPSRRQGWRDGGFLFEPPPRRGCGQGVSTQSNAPTAHSDQNHAGCLCRISPRRGRSETNRRVAEACPSAKQ